MKNLVVNVQSAVNKGEFSGMIQYDDGTTSIATRYKDYTEFKIALDAVYEFTPVKDYTEFKIALVDEVVKETVSEEASNSNEVVE